MDYYQIMKWLELIAYICGFLAAGLITLEVISWIPGWRERRRAYKRNHHARPKNWWEE